MQIATWVAIVWNYYLARKYSCILINLEERSSSNQATTAFHSSVNRATLDPNFATEEQDETDPINIGLKGEVRIRV